MMLVKPGQIQTIPLVLKPAIPRFFNFCDSVMHFESFVYLVDSSGTSHRMNSQDKSASAISEKTSNNEYENRYIGILLIVGQCIVSVAQALIEEFFARETDFHPTLLLGYEGLFGEDPTDTIDKPSSSTFKLVCAARLSIFFTLAGILLICATAVTCNMTRNVWKNLCMGCVWLLVLGDNDVGETWSNPDLYIILVVFLGVVLCIQICYKSKPFVDESKADVVDVTTGSDISNCGICTNGK